MRLRVPVIVVLGTVATAAVTVAVVVSSGTGLSTQPRSTSATATPHVAAAATPHVVVSPRTNLVTGELLRITLVGYPAGAEESVSECPSADDISWSGCMSEATGLGINTAGGAATILNANALEKGSSGVVTTCTTQCVVAVVEARTSRPKSAGPRQVTVPLSFRPATEIGLAQARLLDVSWVSAQEGWALASLPCATRQCAVVAQTTDGGTRWTELPGTPALITSPQCHQRLPTTQCVHDIAFASATVGYLYSPGMYMTSDGGKSWEAVKSEEVETLAVASAEVLRVVYSNNGCPGPCTAVLQAAAVGSTTWRTIPLAVDHSDATVQILSAGSDDYVAMYIRPPMGGPPGTVLYRSVDGATSFEALVDPCLGLGSALGVLGTVALAPDGTLDGVCADPAGGPRDLVTSTDDGTTWASVRLIPFKGAIAAASATTVAVAVKGHDTDTTTTEKLRISVSGADTGTMWSTPAIDRSQYWTVATYGTQRIGFVTSTVGWWLADPHSIWRTIDGGTHWTQLPLS